MKKNILVALIVLVLVILGFVMSRKETTAPVIETKQVEKSSPTEKMVQEVDNSKLESQQEKSATEAESTQSKKTPEANNQTNEKKPMELEIKTTKEGTGSRAVKAGDSIAVHYTGTLTDGTKFDSSVDRGVPFEFVIGQGMVIAGWEQGLLGMKVGEKRTLTIPSEMGYGTRGAGAIIPPNATLVFETELISIK